MMADVQSNAIDSAEQSAWLDDIQQIFEDSGLLTATQIDIEEAELGTTKVYYVVALSKNDEQERVATVYASPTESYDAEAVADIFAAVFDLVPQLVDIVREGVTEDVEKGSKYGAVKFMINRAVEAMQDETTTIETLKALIGSMSAIVNSDAKPDVKAEKKEDKVSLLHLLPDAARKIFGVQ